MPSVTISAKHAFTSGKGDGLDASLIQPSNWNAEHTITLAADSVLGRSTAGAGAVEEIPCGSFGRTLLALADATALGALVASIYAAIGRTISAGGIATGGGTLDADQTITVTKATSTEFLEVDGADKALTTDVIAAGAIVDLGNKAGTVVLDFHTFINAKLAMTGNITLGQPTNLVEGRSGLIKCSHSGGTRTITLDSLYWKTAGGLVLTLEGTNGDDEFLFYFIDDDDFVYVGLASNVAAP
jgi:hypothetical protein